MQTNRTPMNPVERRAVSSLAVIFSLRMLGLFLILPVISVAARDLDGFTPTLAGLALGIYGLSQGLMQIPFGYLSDKFGRKRIITVGLLMFAAGSIVAALSTSIYGVIAGRALQGAGAIASVVLALVADVTREQQRTKSMAVIGGSIGMAFMLALVLGPLLEGWLGLNGMFWVIGALALAVLPVLWWWTPNAVSMRRTGDAGFDAEFFKRVLSDPQLVRFDIGIFALHLALTAVFVVIPLQLVDVMGVDVGGHWKIYIPVLILSVVGMVPMLILAHRRNLYAPMLALAIVLMLVSELFFGFLGDQFWWLVIALWLFFVGFNALEAMLPSLISRLAPAGAKGTVMGIYSSFEFVGIFIGGFAGGWLFGEYGAVGVYGLAAAALIVWLALVLTAPPFKLLDSVTLKCEPGGFAESGLEALAAIKGVKDSTWLSDEGLVYLKVDKHEFDPAALETIPGIRAV